MPLQVIGLITVSRGSHKLEIDRCVFPLEAKQEAVRRLEKEMMKGRARWVADFNESFRDYRVGDVIFDLFISGNTRMKGFLISRFFSFFLNPNYEVGFFAISLDPADELSHRWLRKRILAVKSVMSKSEMKWAWLTIIGQSTSESATKCIKEATDPSVGVAYVDITSHQTISADTYLGRQLKKNVRL